MSMSEVLTLLILIFAALSYLDNRNKKKIVILQSANFRITI